MLNLKLHFGKMPWMAPEGLIAIETRQGLYTVYKKKGLDAMVWVEKIDGEWRTGWREGRDYVAVWHDDEQFAHDFALLCLTDYAGKMRRMFPAEQIELF